MEDKRKVSIEKSNRIIDDFVISNNYYTRIDEELTYVGAICKHEIWCAMSIQWNEETMNNYLKYYFKVIFHYLQAKPISVLVRDDYDKLVEQFIMDRYRENRSTGDDVIRQFKFLLAHGLRVAAKAGLCRDILWGTTYQLSKSDEKGNKQQSKDLRKLPKSLRPNIEKAFIEKVMRDHTQSGSYMGLALIFGLGPRENEAAQIKFSDIMRLGESEFYAAYIYSSSDKDTRSGKAGGKTKNMFRKIPVCDLLLELIEKRKIYLKEITGVNSVDDWPIACNGTHYEEAVKPSELSAEGTELLRQIHCKEDEMIMLEEALLEMHQSNEYDTSFETKSPTTYLLRRNFGTHMYVCLDDENDIKYAMGHVIEDEDDDRKFYSDERIIEMAKKMRRRPGVNREIENVFYLENGKSIAAKNENKITINTEIKPGERLIIATKNFNNANGTIKFSQMEGLEIDKITMNIPDSVDNPVNVIKYYTDRYNN